MANLQEPRLLRLGLSLPKMDTGLKIVSVFLPIRPGPFAFSFIINMIEQLLTLCQN